MPGNVVAQVEHTEVAYGGGHEATIKQAFVNATAAGNTQVIAAVTGKKLRVLWVLVGNSGSAVVDVNFQSSASAITATQPLAVDGGFMANCQPSWFCETVAGEALNVNLSALGAVAVTLGYIEV